MQISFRQGLIAYQQSNGVPQYLQASTTAGFVSHVIAPSPTVVTFAHAGSNYLVKFDSSVNLGWQITGHVTTYMYWDIDQLTAVVARGTTTLIPVNALNAPSNPANDQHWFDLSTNTMQVWSAPRNKWNTRIRLFAGHALSGSTAALVMFTSGSQIGLNTPSNPGYIMLDSMLQPLKKSTLNGEFLTDMDSARVLTTVGTSGVLVQPISHVVPVRAGEAIGRMSMVYFSAADTIRLAASDPGLMPRPPVGMCMEALASGDIGTIVQSGEITYDQWDWSAHPGAALYCDSSGQLTITRPAGLMVYRVGFVKNARTVLLLVDAESTSQIITTGPPSNLVFSGIAPVTVTDVVNGIGERVIKTQVSAVTSFQSGLMTSAMLLQLTSFDSRIIAAEGSISTLQSTKANILHTHIISDTTGLQAALDAKSAIGHNHDSLYAQINHTHVISNVSGLQTALDGRALLIHTHTMSDVIGLAPALAGKTDIGHAHAITDVTGLQTALNGKANTTHSHVTADISDFSSAVDLEVGTLLVAGGNITLTRSAGPNRITIASSATASIASLTSTTVTL